jgi:hypothetical protein
VQPGQQALFDYSQYDQQTQIFIQVTATEIKTLAKRVAADIVEIGGKLAAVKDRLGGNGKFVEWLGSELRWSERTAYNFIGVHAKSASANFALENVAASALYLLAAPSTPPAAIQAAKEIADSGEEVTHTVAKEIVKQAKKVEQAKQPAFVEDDDEDEEPETTKPAAKSSPATPAASKAETKRDLKLEEMFRKAKIEISLTLMPPQSIAGRQFVGSINAAGYESLFFTAKGYEDTAILVLQEKMEQFRREMAERKKSAPAKTTAAKPAAKAAAKKPTTKPAAKVAKGGK